MKIKSIDNTKIQKTSSHKVEQAFRKVYRIVRKETYTRKYSQKDFQF